jgi:hypothetical protein
MPHYLLTVCYPPDGVPPSPAAMQTIMRDVAAVREELKATGAWVFAAGLHPPSSATVVRPKGGEIITVDGPFAEGKEHVGGFSIIKVTDLDAALDWGRKLSRATTTPIEVRPLREEGHG